MDQAHGGCGRPSRPIYIHELNDWPDFRWDEEAVAQPLERASRRQRDIVADASNMGTAEATEATVRNLKNSAVASSRIEDEYPLNAVEAAIRRRIRAVPPGTDQGELNEPGIATVTANTATNHSVPLTADRLHCGTACCSQAQIVPISRLASGATTGWAPCASSQPTPPDEPSSTSKHRPHTGSKTR